MPQHEQEVSGKKVALIAAAGFVAAAALMTAWKSFDTVSNGYYGIRERLGKVDPTELSPDWYWKQAWRESIWSFNNNVVRREIKVGSSASGENGTMQVKDLITHDRNPFNVDMRVHYKIDPKVGLLSLHLREMADNDGEALLTSLADNSVRLLAGQKDVDSLLHDPTGFLKTFGSDFTMRLAQNNVPIKLEMIELLDMNAGGLRKITALRWRPDGTIEAPAGTAAIAVPLAPQPLAPLSSPPEPR